MNAFERLLDRVDDFIRKYYKNQIIKGVLLFIGVFIATYLVVISLEYFGRFNSFVRGVLLFTFIGVNISILIKYIIIPLLKLKSYGPRIDRYQASVIIGRFFPSVSDRLLNTLQLKDQLDENSSDYELLSASIQQKSSSLYTVPFADAIDLKLNRRYLKWVLPLVVIVLLLALFVPSFFKQGTERVLHFSKEFAIPAPFKFSFLPSADVIEEGSDFDFVVELIGNEIPNKVYVRSDKGTSLLKRVSKNRFTGSLKQVRKSTSIQFAASEFVSDEFAIKVIGKSSLAKLQASLIYPSYLGLENEVVENASDLVVPEGTVINWKGLAKNSSKIEFLLDTASREYFDSGFVFSSEILDNCFGQVVLWNKHNGFSDTTSFNVDVIKDEYPIIHVDVIEDSLKDGVRFFSGTVSDDHGVSSLSFVYEVISKSGEVRKNRLPISGIHGTDMPFDYAVDFRRENLSLEDRIEYYFVVTDNDQVNGAKSSVSTRFVYQLPNLDELNDDRLSDQEKSKEDLSRVLDKVEEFKRNIDLLRNDVRDSKQSNWKNRNQSNELVEEYQSILEDLNSIREEMKNSIEEKNQLSEIDEELLEKQDMINDLLEELMDEELKSLLEELQELMEKNQLDQLQDKLDDIEMSSDDMKKQLDRSMEMLKRLQVNEKIDDIENELNQLAEEQQELSDKMDNLNKEEADSLQEEINKKFDDIQKDLQKLDSLNSELNSPMELGDTESDANEISDDLNDAKSNIDKGKKKKAKGSQSAASEKMKKMASKLDAKQQESNQKQQSEDISMLRNILESLVSLSLDQEELISKFRRLRDSDPSFKTYSLEQRAIIDNTNIVADSLNALAKRQPKIAMFIDKELNDIRVNHKLALRDIDEFQNASSRRSLAVHQQYVMTAYNNLALMLNESLQQMQEQMKNMMPGSGSCDNPGGSGKPSLGDTPSTEDMKEMLKQQLDQMKKGSNSGGKNKGSKGDDKNGLGNKEIAKMAAQQSLIRKRLEEMRKSLNKDGKGLGNQLNPLIEKLQEQERELVNKRFNSDLIERQKEILTRLLESEKAIMERGWDEKRESKEGKIQEIGNQIQFDQYNKEKLEQIELIRTISPNYKKYYRDRASEYMNRAMN